MQANKLFVPGTQKQQNGFPHGVPSFLHHPNTLFLLCFFRHFLFGFNLYVSAECRLDLDCVVKVDREQWRNCLCFNWIAWASSPNSGSAQRQIRSLLKFLQIATFDTQLGCMLTIGIFRKNVNNVTNFLRLFYSIFRGVWFVSSKFIKII